MIQIKLSENFELASVDYNELEQHPTNEKLERPKSVRAWFGLYDEDCVADFKREKFNEDYPCCSYSEHPSGLDFQGQLEEHWPKIYKAIKPVFEWTDQF